MKFSKLIIAVILLFSMAIFLASPVFASYESSVNPDVMSFGDALYFFARGSDSMGIPVLPFILDSLGQLIDPNNHCAMSGDGLHHGEAKSIPRGGGRYSQDERYVTCTCDYCGEDFIVNVGRDSFNSAFKEGYDNYVNDVQDNLGTTIVGNNYFTIPLKATNGELDIGVTSIDVIANLGFNSVVVITNSAPRDDDTYYVFCDWPVAPVDGEYFIRYSYSLDKGNIGLPRNFLNTQPYPLAAGADTGEKFNASSQRDNVLFSLPIPGYISMHFSGSFWLEVHPYSYSVNDFTVNIGGIDSRSGSITGGLGIIGDNGTINQFNNYVFNEETNYYYSPSTNTNQTVNEWQYDYTTRSYTLKLDDGREITVTYGDDYILVLEDGQEYKIYYLMDGEGGGEDPGPTPGPSGHVHNYTSKTTQNPTCTGTGTRTYTCQECGESYTEEIPALGHSWHAVETVDPEYGEDGSVVKEGYTLYRCSVCQEEYKDTTGSGPPDSGPNTPGGVLGWFQKIYNKLCDILEAITGLELSPEIDVDVEVDQDGQQQDQQSWFTSFVGKFAWLSDASKIYKQLVADVTSDAATASLVAEGSVSLDEVTGDHAAIAGNTRLTAPELAISFGSSDKYGVDWDSIQPVDLSWYTPYKKTVDSIVSGILWATYIFLLIKRAPGIIQGAEMVTEDSIKISKW